METRFLSRKQTLNYVLDNAYSISRYGDGELKLAIQSKFSLVRGLHFQKSSSELRARLNEILLHPTPNLMVCVNHEFTQLSEYRVVIDYERSKKQYVEHRSIHRVNDVGILSRTKERKRGLRHLNRIINQTSLESYGEATCFMLCFFYEDYVNGSLAKVMNLYRRFFEDKRILFVCPKNPLMGNSFDNLCAKGVIRSPRSVDFIFIPDRHCFEYYYEIMDEIMRHAEIDSVLIQAGPSATVMAADLAKHGRTTYDVGSWNVSLEKAYLKHGRSF